VPVTAALIKAGLINASELDLQLTKLMEANRLSAIEFGAKLIHYCVFDPQQACVARNQFANSLATLARIAQHTTVSEK
jgi:hypothetical protein